MVSPRQDGIHCPAQDCTCLHCGVSLRLALPVFDAHHEAVCVRHVHVS